MVEIAESYDPAKIPLFPAQMTRFGLNPHQDPLWRIVHASSRRNLVIDDEGTPHWLLTYWQVTPPCWILERWLAPEEFAQCTRETWDLNLAYRLGPWPDRGEYTHAHTFDLIEPAQCNLDKLIAWIEEGRKRSAAETTVAVKEAHAKEKQDRRANQAAMIDDAFPFKLDAPLSAGRHGRGTKTRSVVRSANELGIGLANGQKRSGAIGNNKFVNLKGDKTKYAVPLDSNG